jgi:uncharacterized protein YbjT (DUF2867 family)
VIRGIMPLSQLLLITGATGYIGGKLIPLLLARGHRVRCMVREPERMRGHRWLPRVEVLRGNVSDPASLPPAMRGVEAVYYLVHSMASGRGYSRLDLQAARNVREAAAAAGVKHIIYLGGLADPADPFLSPHMRSRIETGEELARGPVPVTEFRASVIIGPGSISFEMIRFLTEQMPVLAGPRWLLHRGQPIAARDVMAYLLAALDCPQGGVFEIGGPEAMPYTEIMLCYARARGLRRGLILLPWMPLGLMAWLIEKMTPVPRTVARPLVEGLMSDSVIHSNLALRSFPDILPLNYQSALHEAIAELHPDNVEPVWIHPGRPVTIAKYDGFLIDHRRVEVEAPAETGYDAFIAMGGRAGWLFADGLWRLRAWVDRLLGGPGMRGREATLRVGAPLDFYRIEALEPGRRMLLHSELKAPGEGWMEWRADPLPDGKTRLSQTAYFAPRGLWGFAYWYGLAPVHRLVFRGLLRKLAARSRDRT